MHTEPTRGLHLKQRFLILSIVLSLPFLTSAQNSKGSAGISGRVTVDTGAPVANAKVALHGIHRTNRDVLGHLTVVGPKRDLSFITTKDGTFQFGELEAGEYALCALPNEQGLLASCRWGSRSVLVKVAAGELAKVTLSVLRGIRVDFNIADSSLKLQTNPRLVIGVMTPSGYYARASSPNPTAPGQYISSVTVPFGQTFRLFAAGELAITEPGGKDIPRGVASLEFQASVREGDLLVIPIEIKQ
jgi:hypothetical protein